MNINFPPNRVAYSNSAMPGVFTINTVLNGWDTIQLLQFIVRERERTPAFLNLQTNKQTNKVQEYTHTPTQTPSHTTTQTPTLKYTYPHVCCCSTERERKKIIHLRTSVYACLTNGLILSKMALLMRCGERFYFSYIWIPSLS